MFKHYLSFLNMRKKFLLTASLLAQALMQAQGQTNQIKDSLKEKDLPPVEIRALRAGSGAPFAKTDVSKEYLEKLNLGQDLPVLLQYTPSAVVTSDAGAGIGYTSLRIRGTDNTRINLTLNGIPVNEAESQGAFFVDFPDMASSVNSIQLQRGVGSSTNGAGAFGATMSISTLQQMDSAGAETNISAGSFNTQKYTIKAGTGLLRNGLQFDVRLSKISSDGFLDRSYSDLRALQFVAGWKASEKTSFRFLLMTGKERTGQAWNGTPEEKLKGNDSTLLAHYYNNLGVLYFTPRDSVNLFSSDKHKYNYFTYDDQSDNYQQDYYQFFFDHNFSERLTANIALFFTRGKGFYNEYKIGQSYSAYGLSDYITPSNDTISSTDLVRQLWLSTKYYGGVYSLLYSYRKTQLTFGGSIALYNGEHFGFVKWAQYNIPADYKWYHLTANKSDVNFYVKAQQEIGSNLTVFGDLQYRTVTYEMNGFRNNPGITNSVNYGFFNPKAGLNYMLQNASRQRQRVYASVALANKEPNRDDFEASPAQLPRPERLTDVEAGYELNAQAWSASANFYYMNYKDQLILTGKINDVGAYTRINVPQSYRAGIELETAVKPAWWLTVSANGTYSQNKILNFTEYQDNYDAGGQLEISHGTTDIAFSPNLIAAGGLTFSPLRNVKNSQKLELDIMGKYVGQQFLDNTANPDRSIDAYGLCDVRLRYSIKLRPFRELGFSLALNNVLSTEYESNGYTYSYVFGGATTTQNFYYPQAGFNFLGGINIKW
jgi:iron complex outermembrane receptor protein